MVEEQLIPRGIKDTRVIDAFLKVERHRFVPEELKGSAYADHPLSIGEKQTISQPYIVALMTECLNLCGSEKILEIGTGSGYQAAILAELSNEVYSIERLPTLTKQAESLLHDLGYSNIRLKTGDGTLGWPEESPFSRVIITAAAPNVPLPLTEQLLEEGKMVIPIGETFSQVLTVIEKKKGHLEEESICSCVFVPLIGRYGYNSQTRP